MCGIAGFVCSNIPWVTKYGIATGRAMADAIRHRGPDDQGEWVDGEAGVVFVHRRLAIVDLSREGHQPMVSASGRFRVVFNGEIYNYSELRRELDRAGESVAWRGHSDTEVLLAACEAWGIDGTIQRCNGMFAIALWDSLGRTLTLIRDRMGEKPLYYGWWRNAFLFASELKAIEAFPGFNAELELRGLSAYLRFGYVPGPLSIYEGIHKLGPGEIFSLDANRGRASERRRRYWSVPLPCDEPMDSRAAVDQLDELLKVAVRSRMHADVPLGAFLSGGIDSSTIAALMQDAGTRRVRTYSIGVRNRRHNEADHAAAVANALGTEHEELYLEPSDALDVVPHLPVLYDEPFADSSQIPTYVLCKLTRQRVTVALSGDAGDELFGGYVRYMQVRRLLSLFRVVPQSARHLISSGLRGLAGPRWDRACALGPRGLSVTLSSDRLRKLADVVDAEGYQDIYRRLVSYWRDPAILGPTLPHWRGVIDDDACGDGIREPASWMMYVDSLMYLPEDILVKVDRASMGVSLEARVPFLDHRVVEFAARLPLSLKLSGGQGKWVLRQVLYRYLDRTLVDRPKQGFAVPIAEWLRGALRDWAEDLLSDIALSESGLLDPVPVRKVWAAHLRGDENYPEELWAVLMLQSWLRRTRSVRRAQQKFLEMPSSIG